MDDIYIPGRSTVYPPPPTYTPAHPKWQHKNVDLAVTRRVILSLSALTQNHLVIHPFRT